MSARRHHETELDKALAAAKRAGLKNYRVVKRGREIIVEVNEGVEKQALDDEDLMRRAVGA